MLVLLKLHYALPKTGAKTTFPLPIITNAKTDAKTFSVLPKNGAKTDRLHSFLGAHSKSFSIGFSREYRRSFSMGDAKTNFRASFSQLLLKPLLKLGY